MCDELEKSAMFYFNHVEQHAKKKMHDSIWHFNPIIVSNYLSWQDTFEQPVGLCGGFSVNQ